MCILVSKLKLVWVLQSHIILYITATRSTTCNNAIIQGFSTIIMQTAMLTAIKVAIIYNGEAYTSGSNLNMWATFGHSSISVLVWADLTGNIHIHVMIHEGVQVSSLNKWVIRCSSLTVPLYGQTGRPITGNIHIHIMIHEGVQVSRINKWVILCSSLTIP